MKITNYLAVAMFVLSLLCVDQLRAQETPEAHLTINFVDADVKSFTLIEVSSLDRETYQLDDKGVFSGKVGMPGNAGEHWIQFKPEGSGGINEIPCYLSEGNKMKVSIMKEQGKGWNANFSGDGEMESNYYLSRRDIQMSSGGALRDFTLKCVEYKKSLNKLYAELKQHLDSFGLDETFVTQERTVLKKDEIYNLLLFPRMAGVFGKSPDIQDGYYDVLSDLDLNTARNDFGEGIFQQAFDYQTSALAEEKNIAIFKAQKKILKGMEEEERAFLTKTLSAYVLDNSKVSGAYMDYVADNIKDKAFVDSISTSYEQLASTSKENAAAPELEKLKLADVNGETVSIKDFRGQYVYIDLWATWCTPCKAQMAHMKVIEKEYHDKNIRFVSISIDKEKAEEKWKEMVESLDVGGTQVIVDRADSGYLPFAKRFTASGIPRFILLDTEGNVVSEKAPPPSSKNRLSVLFNSLDM